MKKLASLFIMLLLCSVTVSAQILRPFTARYYNPSVKGNIVYVSNSIVSSAGIGSGNPGTGEAPPGGSSTNNSTAGINIDIDGPFPATIVALGSSWKYLANNTRPANWETSGYNDAAWPNGNGQLGYGDGDEATCVPSGGGGTLCVPTGNKYVSTYFRKTVNIANPGIYNNFSLGVYRDDGVVVYVNGTEVYRDNMPGGAVTHATLASAACGDDGTALQTVTLPTSAFSSGNNTIAVEIHQNDVTSSDISFDLQLLGNPVTQVSLFPLNSTWKYLANNTRPANWETTVYNDAAWPSGNGQFGYGDGDETTCVPSGGGGTVCAPTGNKYVTTYFRKTINIPNPSVYSYLSMGVYRDDGVVVYVNGTEVFRDNMPVGAVTHATLASTACADDGTTLLTFNLPPSSFVSGNNTIAVEVHQNDITSSDLSFDMQLVGNTDSTFNSSSSDLNLATCSTVLFAGLYWGAGQGNSGSNSGWITGETSCKLKLPGAGSFTNITSTQTDYWNNTLVAGYAHTGYACFADITSLVNITNPNGTYTLANVAAPIGIGDSYGGWTIVIVYSNSSLLPRNLTVFDGTAIVKSGSGNVDVAINGFLTPPIPAAVSCELGAVVYDGDRTSSDGFQFKQASAASYYDLTPTANNPTSNLNDMWNSTISYKGSVINTRNPAFQNTLGYDADIIDLPNAGNAQLGNSQTSASVRFFSPSENYITQVLTTSISQYNPAFAFNKSATDINGGATAPGDSLRYQINYQNVGNDASTNTAIIDNIPLGTTYLPGSLRIGGIAKTDAVGDDQAEYDAVNNRVIFRIGTGANGTTGGTVNTGTSGNVQFDVIITSSCRVLSCVGSINNKASISYTGLTSGAPLVDTSGVSFSGCIVAPFAVSHTPVGICFTPADTLMINRCPATSMLIPWRRYAGYTIYSAQPFIPANLYNVATPVTASHVYWAYFSNGAGCSDTVKINMIITRCPDIDDDNDGIPDYVEFNNLLSTQDANSNAVPNWNDATYPGYVDTNTDNVNDNFDWGADANLNLIPNFRDPTFWIAWVDVNGDGINDRSDRDLDGIPNQYDLDSDNDGIPDTVESYGVDANGDGIIDNYTDTDLDGFSQNVDANNTGVNGSNVGLGAQDLDGDLIPNYLDADSDNDGIPDVVEVFGTDANNDGVIDNFVDVDGDGYSDQADSDVGNDAVIENAIGALLRTSGDVSPVDGRADSYPFKNMDNDRRANPYDLDSDADGIVDVLDGGFLDANFNGFIDGVIGADGWSVVANARVTLNLNNTDGRGNPDYLDIDSDDDGIPDNVEGQTTTGYVLPSGTDTDVDGIDNSYDGTVGFGGSGVFLSDKDSDNLPDYRDLDTDADGVADIVEGNDFNLNNLADDNVTLTLLDTDNDGLDNRFDSLTSTINIKGTSYRMGNGGSLTGDAAPGSKCTVQKRTVGQPDRDWRYVGIVLNVQLLDFTAVSQINNAVLSWGIISPVDLDRFEVERSTDNMIFEKVQDVDAAISLNELHRFSVDDNIGNVNSELIYYRLKVIAKNGSVKFSSVVLVKKYINKTLVSIQPNPAAGNTAVIFNADRDGEATIRLIDAVGKVLLFQKQKTYKGNNSMQLNGLSRFGNAVYSVQITINGEVITKKLIIQNR